MSSIPSHNASAPILSRGRKLFLIGMVVAPVVSYVALKSRQNARLERRRLLEEEGRKNWSLAEQERRRAEGVGAGEGALSVDVRRSGGGV